MGSRREHQRHNRACGVHDQRPTQGTEPSVHIEMVNATMIPRAVCSINSLLCVVQVDMANPPSVASLLFDHMRAADPDATFTFYGTDYLFHNHDFEPEPDALDYADLHEVTKSTEQPES